METRPSTTMAMVALLAATPTLGVRAQTAQEHVHAHSHSVMPFDLSKTLHIFEITEQGGVESIVTTGSDSAEQLALVQAHLRHEAEAFQKGDYADPVALHGAAMPGLKELQEGAARIKVSYTDLPNGAAIVFETADLHLLTAIHKWFGAQLSEHGADARAE